MTADSPGALLLDVRGLHKSFGGVAALRDCSLQVRSGEVVAVIGSNGSGKTTLFNVITGIVPPDRGAISFGAGAAALAGRPAWEIASLGIARTFQNIRLVPSMTVLENVETGLYRQARGSWSELLLFPRRQRAGQTELHERATAALALVAPQLLQMENRPVAELSYADRRRVELARAVAAQPRLLLLDEPAAGMNASETDRLRDDLLRIRSAGVTLLVIEHKMKFVSQLTQHIVVMSHGGPIAKGSYEQICINPAVIESYLGRRSTVVH